eukprot:891131-Rhodomonas_salina.1
MVAAARRQTEPARVEIATGREATDAGSLISPLTRTATGGKTRRTTGRGSTRRTRSPTRWSTARMS